MSNKAIAWTVGILLGVMFLYIAVAGFNSSVESVSSRPTTTVHCSRCGTTRNIYTNNTAGALCKDCYDLLNTFNKYR